MSSALVWVAVSTCGVRVRVRQHGHVGSVERTRQPRCCRYTERAHQCVGRLRIKAARPRGSSGCSRVERRRAQFWFAGSPHTGHLTVTLDVAGTDVLGARGRREGHRVVLRCVTWRGRSTPASWLYDES
ncbi:unnamed protein product [Leptidea sinapis]|uniref:Uncharacterized protein n=1 Tax=Leptidea sinapis TaxID=189913 RepID=A0A5E4QS25_9NEOP|nr:unnamed protein product [Leptidea sinapis]